MEAGERVTQGAGREVVVRFSENPSMDEVAAAAKNALRQMVEMLGPDANSAEVQDIIGDVLSPNPTFTPMANELAQKVEQLSALTGIKVVEIRPEEDELDQAA